MTTGPARALLLLAFGLAMVVVTASSGLRLAANGLGCEPWPRCYGSPATASAVQQRPEARAARLSHRVAASAFVVAVLGAVLFGWRAWGRPARTVAGLLLAVTALLSVVGRYTPSTVPAVTLINVVGGLALLGGTAFLLATQPSGPGRGRSAPRLAVRAAAAGRDPGGKRGHDQHPLGRGGVRGRLRRATRARHA